MNVSQNGEYNMLFVLSSAAFFRSSYWQYHVDERWHGAIITPAAHRAAFGRGRLHLQLMHFTSCWGNVCLVSHKETMLMNNMLRVNSFSEWRQQGMGWGRMFFFKWLDWATDWTRRVHVSSMCGTSDSVAHWWKMSLITNHHKWDSNINTITLWLIF